MKDNFVFERHKLLKDATSDSTNFQPGKYKYALPVLAVGFAFQAILIFGYMPEFLNYSSGKKNPDQLFSYDYQYLQALYQELADEGRKHYLHMLGVDFLYTTISAWVFLYFGSFGEEGEVVYSASVVPGGS
jgi:hypothetical protein